MKKYILTSLCLLIINIIIAQTDTTERECSTPDIDTTEFQELPWFDNNHFLGAYNFNCKNWDSILWRRQLWFSIDIFYPIWRNVFALSTKFIRDLLFEIISWHCGCFLACNYYLEILFEIEKDFPGKRRHVTRTV